MSFASSPFVSEVSVYPPPAEPPLAPEFRRLYTLLSPAEKVVAGLVAQGLSNREVALVLQKREATIKNQLAAVMKKMEVASRSRLIVLILTGSLPEIDAVKG